MKRISCTSHFNYLTEDLFKSSWTLFLHIPYFLEKKEQPLSSREQQKRKPYESQGRPGSVGNVTLTADIDYVKSSPSQDLAFDSGSGQATPCWQELTIKLFALLPSWHTDVYFHISTMCKSINSTEVNKSDCTKYKCREQKKTFTKLERWLEAIDHKTTPLKSLANFCFHGNIMNQYRI